MKNNILIVDDLHPAFMQQAEAKGYVCDYHPDFTLEDVIPIIANYAGLALRSKFEVDKTVMDAAVNLKFIARAGAGIDNIDGDYAQQKGIQVISASEGNADAVGEHAIALLLALMNKLNIGNTEVRNGLWLREENRGYE
ncbi:MAG: phosphoglycerate dehydrogenase, partial [Mucilaginibacter sp.]